MKVQVLFRAPNFHPRICEDFLDKNTWHRLGPPFANMAMFFKIRVTEGDIEYINNIIKKDKVYNLIKTKRLLQEGDVYI